MPHFVKQWRELRGLTQEQLADRIGLAHKGSIQKIEKHPDRDLPQRRVEKFAEIFGITPKDIFRSPAGLRDTLPKPDTLQSVEGEQGDTGGRKNMVNELNAWIEEAADLSPDLIPAARKLLRTLKSAAGGEQRPANPQTRAKGR